MPLTRVSPMGARALLRSGAACAALAFASAAAAQTVPAAPSPSARPDATVDEVIVTANKREERLKDVAMAVSAIKGEDLETRQLQSFQDYAPLIPSLSLQSIDATRTRVTLRGQNAGGQGTTVGIYIDDSPIGSSTALADGSIYTPNGDTWDLQRLEVLRGPQGTLYGANAEGGLLKFVTNPPDPTKYSAAVQGGYQSIDGSGSGGSVKGVVNAPLLDGKAAVRLSAYYEDLPGFIDDTLRKQDEVNHGYREGVRFSALYKPTRDLTLRFTAFHQDVKAAAQPYVDAVGSTFTGANPPSNRFDPSGGDLEQQRYLQTHNKASLTNGAFTADWNLGWIDLTSITSYSETRTDNSIDLTSRGLAPGFSYGQYFGGAVFGLPLIAIGEDQTVNLKKFTEELRFSNLRFGPVDVQGGVFYTHEKGNFFQALPAYYPDTAAPATPNFGTDFIRTSYSEISGFAEATYHVTPKWDVSAGGRYSHNDQGLNLGFNGILYGGTPDYSARNVLSIGEDVFTYSFGSKYKLTDDSLVYGRIASGYRPGGPNLVPPGAPADYPLSYGSDSTVTYEAGYRTDLLDKTVSVDLAYFYIDWSDIQVATVVNGYGVIGNAGGATSTGVEWTLGYRPLAGLTLGFTGSYTAAELSEDAPGVGGLKGKQLAYVPKIAFAFDGDYRWKLADGYDAFVGATYAYTGSRFTDFGTSPIYEPHTKLPDYSTVALRAGVTWKNLTAEVYGKNVTDERGITIYGNSGTPGNNGFIGIIQPRTFGVTLTAKL